MDIFYYYIAPMVFALLSGIVLAIYQAYIKTLSMASPRIEECVLEMVCDSAKT